MKAVLSYAHCILHTTILIFVNHLNIILKGHVMRSIASLVESIRSKTEKSIHLHDALQKDNAQLKQTIAGLTRRIEELETLNRQLEEKNRILRLARSISGEADNNLALKLKINELVRDIDKCIAQLGR